MTLILSGFRYPAAPDWLETRIAPGLYQLNHESGRYASVYRCQPGYRRPTFYTIGENGRRVFHAGFREAIQAAEAMGEVVPF